MDDDEYLNINPNNKGEPVGHNSLNLVVEDARKALARIQRGEGITWEGWRDYGVALNEGKSVFKDNDKGFGKWIVSEGLDKFYSTNLVLQKDVRKEERLAAMWISSSPEEEQQALLLFPNARTPRGLHDKWREHEDKLKAKAKEEADDTSDDDTSDIVDDEDITDSLDTKADKTEDENTTSPSGTEKPKTPKASMPIVPEYNVNEAMGAIKGIAQMFGQRYKGTTQDAAQVLLDRIREGYDEDDVGLSIAKDYAKWFLSLKKVFDLAGPEVENFLADKPNLTVVK